MVFRKSLLIILGILFLFSFFNQDSPQENLFWSLSPDFTQKPFVSAFQSLQEELPEPVLIQQNQVLASGLPGLVKPRVLGSLTSSLTGQGGEEIFEYIVQPGDSPSSIAEHFGISLNTLLWANDLSSKSLIGPGQKLIILPVSGVMHIVKKGETLGQIARTYQGKTDEIISFNNLSPQGEIFVGDILVIPEGKMPARPAPSRYASLASSYFICPIASPCRISRGLHWYNAVDLSNKRCGEPVFAAAGGEVQKIGWGRIAGNFIRLLHPNGLVTFYGHLSSTLVGVGQLVNQGQIIGHTGHTGLTYPPGPGGCHLHFEVRGAKNPFGR